MTASIADKPLSRPEASGLLRCIVTELEAMQGQTIPGTSLDIDLQRAKVALISARRGLGS